MWGLCRSGRPSRGVPSRRLAVLLAAALLALQLHARGLHRLPPSLETAATDGDSSQPKQPAATAAATAGLAFFSFTSAGQAAGRWQSSSSSNSSLMQLFDKHAAAMQPAALGLLPRQSRRRVMLSASRTSTPSMLAAIPPLVNRTLCVIQPDTPQDPSRNLGADGWRVLGRTAVLSATAATRMALRHQKKQQAFVAASGTAVLTQQPPAPYDQMLLQHNGYRQQHKAPQLQWDAVLAEGAAAFAAKCLFEHDAAAFAGENLYASAVTADMATQLAHAVDLWYQEMGLYDFSDPHFSAATGRFTQLVWRSSSFLGCAAQLCPSGIANTPFTAGTLIICRYSPPGNVVGQFESNVLKPVAAPPPAGVSPGAPPTAPPVATLPEGFNFVSPGCLVSAGAAYSLCMQADGNLVLFCEKQAIWASNSAGKSVFRPFKLTMQRDGNLVASDNLRQAVWMSSTAGQGSGPYRLTVQDDGSVAVYGASTVLWSTDKTYTGRGRYVTSRAVPVR